MYNYNHTVPYCQCDILMYIAFSVESLKALLCLSSPGPSCFEGVGEVKLVLFNKINASHLSE